MNPQTRFRRLERLSWRVIQIAEFRETYASPKRKPTWKKNAKGCAVQRHING